jgi:hypothetical protein
VKTNIERTTTTVTTHTLTAEDILELLGIAKGKVTFEVPSGADWSGEILPIDTENPITVTAEEKS